MRIKKWSKTGCLILFVLSGLWYLSAFNTRLVANRLKATGVVTSGEAEVRGVAWRGYGPFWFVGWFEGGLSFDILVENTGDEDIEIVKSYIVIRDPFGRELRSEDFPLGGSPKFVNAGSSKPMKAGSIRFPALGFQLLTWTEAEVHVVVAPAGERVDLAIRSSDLSVTKAGYDEDGYYVIEGEVEAHIVEKIKEIPVLRRRAIVTFYNEEGEFIGYAYITLADLTIDEESGAFMVDWDSFSLRLERNRFRNGPIDSFIVHYVEYP